MADLSKIKLNGTEYYLKDNVAREEINNLSEVAASGNYDDLINKPIINIHIIEKNGELTACQKDGETQYTFEEIVEYLIDGFFICANYKEQTFLYDGAWNTAGKRIVDGIDLTQTSMTPTVLRFAHYPVYYADSISDNFQFLAFNDNNSITYGIQPGFSTVAFSGNYNDLLNKPTIPDYGLQITDDNDGNIVLDVISIASTEGSF